MSKYKELCNIYNIELENRWENGVDHHHEAMELSSDLGKLDFQDYDDYFGWNFGGDGDNGEILNFQLSVLFEIRDNILKDKFGSIYSNILYKSKQNNTNSLVEALEQLKHDETKIKDMDEKLSKCIEKMSKEDVEEIFGKLD